MSDFTSDHRANPGLHKLYVTWAMHHLDRTNDYIELMYSYSHFDAAKLADAAHEVMAELIKTDAAYHDAAAKLFAGEEIPPYLEEVEEKTTSDKPAPEEELKASGDAQIDSEVSGLTSSKKQFVYMPNPGAVYLTKPGRYDVFVATPGINTTEERDWHRDVRAQEGEKKEPTQDIDETLKSVWNRFRLNPTYFRFEGTPLDNLIGRAFRINVKDGKTMPPEFLDLVREDPKVWIDEFAGLGADEIEQLGKRLDELMPHLHLYWVIPGIKR